jgi:hypothetical protein
MHKSANIINTHRGTCAKPLPGRLTILGQGPSVKLKSPFFKEN